MRLRKLGKNCCPGNLGSTSSIASLTEGEGGLPYPVVRGAEQQVDVV